VIGFDLTSREQELVALARAQGVIARKRARHYDRSHELVPDELPEAAAAPNVREQLEACVAETSGFPLIDTLLLLEETWGTIPFRKTSNDGVFLGGKLVSALGTPEQRARWEGVTIAIALTEPGAGSDPSRIRANAIYDASTDEWVLDGEKVFISLAHSAQAILVFSRFIKGEEKGMSVFVVEKGTPGLTVGEQHDKMGQRGWDTAGFTLTECRIPANNRLAGNMKHTLAVFNSSRPYVSAIGLGFARAALDLTRETLTEAGFELDYDRADAHLPAPVARFFSLEASYEAALLGLLHAKWTEHTSGPDKIEASMTKVGAARAARRILDGCLALLGAEAASERHLLEMWLRDARVCDIYEGPGEVNRLILARELLGYSPAELA
jgi:acyl-CoA dehydrogenase